MQKRGGGGGKAPSPLHAISATKKTPTKNITTLVFGGKHLIIRKFSFFKVLGPRPHKKRGIGVYISLWYTHNINNSLASLQIGIKNITSTARIEELLMSILTVTNVRSNSPFHGRRQDIITQIYYKHCFYHPQTLQYLRIKYRITNNY